MADHPKKTGHVTGHNTGHNTGHVSTKSDKNQGDQWGATGSAGNIKHLPFDGATDKKPAKRGPVSNKKGRNLSIGR